ncbi:hypothetical protein SAMN05216420_101375 [Nitrosospira sp. Nl5]|uniref:hypothetical protein n=1 Tax=Nitrosospira sp. Nl5 TaxID=200120 RepID=UPI00087FC22F|nr:hypothetical protein [Nitrosospira sp. Nl5]SCX93331.1 hypothetical protein SAMN05216420_101375 [Nitrosospira sp. Nl5]
MGDEIDLTNDRIIATTDSAIAKVREAAANIPVGKPGDCMDCGEWSGRLVEGVCAPCRDRLQRGYAKGRVA